MLEATLCIFDEVNFKSLEKNELLTVKNNKKIRHREKEYLRVSSRL